MGVINFSVGNVGKNGLLLSHVRTSGAFTTSTTGTFLADAGADVTLKVGEVLCLQASEAMRILCGAALATSASAVIGHYIPAASLTQTLIECDEAGKVSIIDVA